MSGGPSQGIQPLVRCKHCGRHIGLGGTGTHLSAHRNKGLDILEPITANFEPIEEPTTDAQPSITDTVQRAFAGLNGTAPVDADVTQYTHSDPAPTPEADADKPLMICPSCGESFKSLTRHLSACLKNKTKSTEPYDRSEPVECPVCGNSFKRSGLARHMSAHRTRGAASKPKPKPKNGHAIEHAPVAVHALNGEANNVTPLTTLEVTLAVLSRLSPDGRVAIADLPEVFDWMSRTERVVQLVGGY